MKFEMKDSANIMNWENISEKSKTFKNNKPFKHVFIKGVFKQKFYDKLHETFPKFDETWRVNNDYRKSANARYFHEPGEEPKHDPLLSPEWNKFKLYINSPEFINNFSKFYGK